MNRQSGILIAAGGLLAEGVMALMGMNHGVGLILAGGGLAYFGFAGLAPFNTDRKD